MTQTHEIVEYRYDVVGGGAALRRLNPTRALVS